MLRWMYIVLLLNEIFCKHQVGPFDLWCYVVLGFLCWFLLPIFGFFFLLILLPIGDRRVLKSPTSTVLESICAFKSFSVYLMKLGALTLVAYRLIVVIYFWCIATFISMKFPSSHLKLTLSDISIAYILPVLEDHWLGKSSSPSP
jgi:hypothetical protein